MNVFPMRRRGHGGVLKAVERLVSCLVANPMSEYAFFVVVVDSGPEGVLRRLRRLVRANPRLVLGIAVREIEAWWLADRRNTLAWLELERQPDGTARYWAKGYSPERDRRPKTTLDELTLRAPRLEQHYGDGNTELAREFAEDYWGKSAELDAIAASCPRGFAPFCDATTAALLAEKRRQSRLL